MPLPARGRSDFHMSGDERGYGRHPLRCDTVELGFPLEDGHASFEVGVAYLGDEPPREAAAETVFRPGSSPGSLSHEITICLLAP